MRSAGGGEPPAHGEAAALAVVASEALAAASRHSMMKSSPTRRKRATARSDNGEAHPDPALVVPSHLAAAGRRRDEAALRSRTPLRAHLVPLRAHLVAARRCSTSSTWWWRCVKKFVPYKSMETAYTVETCRET